MTDGGGVFSSDRSTMTSGGKGVKCGGRAAKLRGDPALDPSVMLSAFCPKLSNYDHRLHRYEPAACVICLICD
jgi:hypothetical protein